MEIHFDDFEDYSTALKSLDGSLGYSFMNEAETSDEDDIYTIDINDNFWEYIKACDFLAQHMIKSHSATFNGAEINIPVELKEIILHIHGHTSNFLFR